MVNDTAWLLIARPVWAGFIHAVSPIEKTSPLRLVDIV